MGAGSEAAIVYVAAGLAVSFYVAWNLGANDAANPTDTAVGAGAVTLRQAVLMFSIFAALGAILEGYQVIKTVGKGIVTNLTPIAALAAGLSGGLWITLATWRGLPVSTTQSIVSSTLGVGLAAIALHGGHEIRWSIVATILLSWVTSPLSAIALSFLLYSLLHKLHTRIMERGVDISRAFRWLLVFSLAFSAYSFGVNDVANATGVYVTAVASITGMPDMETMRFLAALGSMGIALGAFTWGYRVIRTVGFKITRLDYVTGAAAELSNALVVWLFSKIPYMLIGYGMPISTTHASVSSIIGVGLAKHRSLKGVNWRTVALILLGWLFTLPVAAGLGALIYTLLYLLLPK